MWRRLQSCTQLLCLLFKELTVLEAMAVTQTLVDMAKPMPGPNPFYRDLRDWLLAHSMPRERVDKQPTKVLLELYIRPNAGSATPPTGQGKIHPQNPRAEFTGGGQRA